jgi:hypothetical protein
MRREWDIAVPSVDPNLPSRPADHPICRPAILSRPTEATCKGETPPGKLMKCVAPIWPSSSSRPSHGESLPAHGTPPSVPVPERGGFASWAIVRVGGDGEPIPDIGAHVASRQKSARGRMSPRACLRTSPTRRRYPAMVPGIHVPKRGCRAGAQEGSAQMSLLNDESALLASDRQPIQNRHHSTRRPHPDWTRKSSRESQPRFMAPTPSPQQCRSHCFSEPDVRRSCDICEHRGTTHLPPT